MQRGRKSNATGLQPIRIEITHQSTLGSGSSPSPMRSVLGPTSTRTRRPLGSSKKKRVSPVKLSDVNFGVLSNKLKPKFRRRLYEDEDVGGRLNSTAAASVNYKVPQAKRKEVDPFKPSNSAQKSRIPQNTTLQRRTMYAQAQRTAVVCPSLPKTKKSPLSHRGTKKSTLKSQNSSRTACNCPEELMKTVEELKSIVSEQKIIIEEAKNDFSCAIKEQKQQFLELLKALQSAADSTGLELLSNTLPANSDDHRKSVGGNKENSGRRSARRSRKSLQVYQSLQGMGCLNTPIVSTRKKETPRTLRTSLSRRVQAQLETLFDD